MDIFYSLQIGTTHRVSFLDGILKKKNPNDTLACAHSIYKTVVFNLFRVVDPLRIALDTPPPYL